MLGSNMSQAVDFNGAGLAGSLFATRSRAVQIGQVTALVVAGLLIRIAFIQSAGYADDVTIFRDWFKSIAVLPPGEVYAKTPGLNYPPMCVLLYELEAFVLRLFGPGTPSNYVFNVAIKLPPILVDGLGAALVYRIARRYASHAWALLGAAFIALNPAIIYDSAHWGQNDSIPTVLALFAIGQLLFGNTVVAWLSITAAIFFKPPVLVLVPLMLAHPLLASGAQRRGSILQTCAGAAGGAAIAVALAVTFFPQPNVFGALLRFAHQFVAFSNAFPFSSLNAFNAWAFFQPFFATDRVKILALSLHAWSDLLFMATAGCIYWRYLKSRDATALLQASTLVLLAFFVILTEMHERYLYYAAFFCATLVFKQSYRWGAAILSLTLLLNMEYSLTFMYLDDAKVTAINRFDFAPWLTRLCSAANIGVLIWLLAPFVRGARPGVGARRRESGRTGMGQRLTVLRGDEPA
jgi:dolichyl-phosphate-mannose-protein mannosyltransferase